MLSLSNFIQKAIHQNKMKLQKLPITNETQNYKELQKLSISFGLKMKR